MKEDDMSTRKSESKFWLTLSKDELPINAMGRSGERCLSENQFRPKLLVGELTKVSTWYKQKKLKPTEWRQSADIPVVICGAKVSLEKVLLHYDGKAQTAKSIIRFVSIFEEELKYSQITIVSPGFIPKSKIREEASLVRLLSKKSQETSFIKFNFTQIEQFWQYAQKHNFTFLVTPKKYLSSLLHLLGSLHHPKPNSFLKLSIYLS